VKREEPKLIQDLIDRAASAKDKQETRIPYNEGTVHLGYLATWQGFVEDKIDLGDLVLWQGFV